LALEGVASVEGRGSAAGGDLGRAGGLEPFAALPAGIEISRFLKIGQGVDETKERFDPGHLQSVANPFVDREQDQVATVLLMGDECAYERADASRIYVGNCGEIENQGFRAVGSNRGLKLKQIGNEYRSRKSQKPLPSPRPG
jgi:hypothetical protein